MYTIFWSQTHTQDKLLLLNRMIGQVFPFFNIFWSKVTRSPIIEFLLLKKMAFLSQLSLNSIFRSQKGTQTPKFNFC